ncbi:MAG: hypothetical protein ACFFB0_20135 [Promethearchaeota archaeon]
MDLENLYLTRYLHCPNCNCMHIIMDRKILACPVCNLFKFKKTKESKIGLSTSLQNGCNYVHNYKQES